MRNLGPLTLALLLSSLSRPLLAAEMATPNLPAPEVVAQVLRASPMVLAATHQVRVEEANRDRLEAGSYEWNLRLGSQQRRSKPTTGPDERFTEWNAAIERPLRLPGKSAADAELGAAGVSVAETARGDALHEGSRNLLKSWFIWLKESATASQWNEQVALLGKQAKATQRRQQLGDAARLESILGDAALAQAEAALAQARVRQQTAAEDLRRRFPGLPLDEPASIAEPVAVTGSANEWIEAILEHSHELELARGETQIAILQAGRSSRDRVPDPSVGFHVARERAGEDHFEADRETVVAESIELLGRDVGLHGQVAAGGLEVLSDGGHVGGAFGAQVAQESFDFGRAFAEPHH